MQFGWGYAPPLIIEAAVRTGLFDALETGPKSAKDLAAATNTSERGVIAIMDALVGLALAARDRDGQYLLTPESEAFLVSSRPGYLGGFFAHVSRDLIPGWLPLTDSLRTGQPMRSVNVEDQGTEFFSSFVEALFPLGYRGALSAAHALAFPNDAPIQVLDVAAGSGVWGIGFAETYPRARVTAVDWAGVIPTTQKVVARRGLSERYDYIAGDIGEVDFRTGYDVATLGQILHSEGDQRSQQLLRRVFQALKPGGMILIAEFLVNDDRTGPPGSLIFSVNMLLHTTVGRAYTFPEIAGLLYAAGFENPRVLQDQFPSLIVAAKPK